MNILDAIVHAQDGAAVRQLGSQTGLGQDQTTAALSALVPAGRWIPAQPPEPRGPREFDVRAVVREPRDSTSTTPRALAILLPWLMATASSGTCWAARA
jgi:hypothetical protein